MLFYIGRLEVGGHIISSIGLAKELQGRGYTIVYASDDGPLRKELEK